MFSTRLIRVQADRGLRCNRHRTASVERTVIAPWRRSAGPGRMATAFLAVTAVAGAIASCASPSDRTTSAAAKSSAVAKPPGTPGMPAHSPPPSSGAPQASFASAIDLPNCAADDLRLRPDGPSAETGEHVFSIRIRNTGVPCVLIGYPFVQLLDGHGAPLQVRYDQGGGGYTTAQPPRKVALPTGAEAVVIVAKYRCDLGPETPAVTALVRLPRATQTASVPAIGNLEYCGANGDGGADDVYVSPIEPDLAAATGH